MAAGFGALSVDHIEYLDQEGVDAIAASGTVAVLLPGAFYYLREKQAPPVAALRKAGVPIAIATDLNPGSSPVHSLLATMNMACVLFGLTPEEALRGVTANAARALGLTDRGMIAAGLKADIALWDAERPGGACLSAGLQPARRRDPQRRSGTGDDRMNDAQPLYARVKDHILENIRSGAWEPGRRVPSENELVESFRISRMTANRALRELTAEGFLARVPGVGTFVKEAPALSSLMELRNIAEEIAQRGHRHSSRLVAKSEIDSNPALAEEFEDRALKRLFHIVIVHEENGVPVQLEDRYVNPAVVPDFLDRDFSNNHAHRRASGRDPRR
jgi:histidine utilization repressor